MKIGIVLQSNKPEHLWNTFRFANTSLKAGHSVQIVLMNEGSESKICPITTMKNLLKMVSNAVHYFRYKRSKPFNV